MPKNYLDGWITDYLTILYQLQWLFMINWYEWMVTLGEFGRNRKIIYIYHTNPNPCTHAKSSSGLFCNSFCYLRESLKYELCSTNYYN
jgi:hypothetical protein